MTSISGTTVQSRPADRFLRVVLNVDAIASGLTGLGFAGTPKMHEDLYGLPPSVSIPTGVFLLLFAVGVWFTGSRRSVDTPSTMTIIALNTTWVLGSIVVIATGVLPLTALGVGFVALQAAVVAALADLEFVGLRRIRRNNP